MKTTSLLALVFTLGFVAISRAELPGKSNSATTNGAAEAILRTGSWNAYKEVPSPEVAVVLAKIQAAVDGAQTMTADFTYTVTSLRQQQLITGKVKMMKPNFMRITYDYMAHPAFPNPVASDGKNIHFFTPQSFKPDRTFKIEPFDPILGAKQASGLEPGGGTYSFSPVAADGSNIHLWDSIAIQAFYNPTAALRYLYGNSSSLKYEGTKTINGVTYDVIQHYFKGGNIAGGEGSSFDQRVYVNPDGFIEIYELQFTSQGRPGIQIMQLSNIKTGVDLKESDFNFAPPQ